jgi:phage repressor protein C with HTH and peptisase S24 domain
MGSANAVAVVVVQDEQVIVVAGAGWGIEAAGLVTEAFSGWL